MLADQDEEKGCWYLALWILQEDSSWGRLVVQVGLHLSLLHFYSSASPGNMKFPNLKQLLWICISRSGFGLMDFLYLSPMIPLTTTKFSTNSVSAVVACKRKWSDLRFIP